MNEEELFNIFTSGKSKFNLHKEVKEFVQSEIINARGAEAAKYYDVFTELINSENNTGWKERHDERVATIIKAIEDIVDDYPSYLP